MDRIGATSILEWRKITPRAHKQTRKFIFATSPLLTAKGALRHRRFVKTDAGRWALALRKRKPYRVTVIALAAKIARIIWAMLRYKEAFLAKPTARA